MKKDHHHPKGPSLTKLLEHPSEQRNKHEDDDEKALAALQDRMLRAQQGLFHRQGRAIVALEGFDAAGKGGAIRRLTEKLDPRGVKVHPIGPPEGDEQGKHWLYRFWARLPPPGTIAVFDRTWYGRVLVERVDELADKKAWRRAYREIREFERMLTDDGVLLVKIFLGISKEEQLTRFESRLKDPYKRWKIGEPDIHARKQWKKYVKAADDLLAETHTENAPWHLVPADSKPRARRAVLETVTSHLHGFEKWMEREADAFGRKDLAASLKELGLRKKASKD